MMPIVNGLEAEFSEEVAFVYLNAVDGAEGQRTFEALSLPGHPSYVVFSLDGNKTYQAFGIVETETLRAAIMNSLRASVETSEP